MNYKQTKEVLMQAYPRLFVDEADVLEHLFATLGTGYSWHNGELTSGQTVEEILAEGRRSNDDVRRMIAEWAKKDEEAYLRALEIAKLTNTKHPRRTNYLPEVTNNPVLERRKERAQRRYYAKTFKSDLYFLRKNGTVEKQLYPLSEYAHLLHIPSDIKPDWRSAALRAITLFRTQYKTTEKDQEWLKKAEKLLITPTKRGNK